MRISDWSSDVCSSDLAEAGDLRHSERRYLTVFELDRAAVDRVVADDRVEQRGLAGAVGADEAGDLAARHRQRDGAVGEPAAERLGNVLDGNHRLAHGLASWPPAAALWVSTAMPKSSDEPTAELQAPMR